MKGLISSGHGYSSLSLRVEKQPSAENIIIPHPNGTERKIDVGML